MRDRSASFLRKSKPKISLLSDTTAQELENVEPDVCAFCFKEDPPSSDGNIVEWVAIAKCGYMHHVTTLRTKMTMYAACVNLNVALKV